MTYPTSTLGSGAYLTSEVLPQHLFCPAVWIREGMYFAVSPWLFDPACDDFAQATELLQAAWEAAFGCDRYPGL